MNRLNDQKWMSLALELAGKGCVGTSPNPMVGACVVRQGRLVGKGFHERYGGPHAEINALLHAGRKARGATLYVTLEPCSSWGKTPPCVAAILQSGIREVVVGALDPNVRHYGKGIAALRRQGIRVRTGILRDKVQHQNAFFIKYITKHLPFVTLKMAQSLDGKIATCQGKSRWISSPTSREFVHRLRNEQDAIMVGLNTVHLDDPLLSPRIKSKNGVPEKPWRIILDPRLEVPTSARVFQGPQLTLVAVSEKTMQKKEKSRFDHKRTLVSIPEKNGKLVLKSLLHKVAGLGVAKLLVEGGGEIAWSLLAEGLVDRVLWIVAPKIIGGRNAKTSVEGEGTRDLDRAFRFREMKLSQLGEDYLFEGSL